MLILVLLLFTVIIFFEAPGLIIKKSWKDLIIFGLFLSAAFIFSLLLVLDVELPNPTEIITNAVEPVIKIAGKLLSSLSRP